MVLIINKLTSMNNSEVNESGLHLIIVPIMSPLLKKLICKDWLNECLAIHLKVQMRYEYEYNECASAKQQEIFTINRNKEHQRLTRSFRPAGLQFSDFTNELNLYLGEDFKKMAGAETRNVSAGEIHELVSQTDLLSTLECPICTEIPLPPIYICENGHNICSSCRKRLSNCGLCAAKLSNTRNFAIEAIVSSSKFKCRYASDGCPEILKGENHADHFTTCQYGPIACFESSKSRCNGTFIPFKEYFTHLKAHHEIAGESDPTNPFPITSSAPDLKQDRSFPCFYMLHDNKQFLSHVRVKNGNLYWWVTIVGNDDDAKRYKARLTLYKEEKEDLQNKVEWTFPVHSVRKQFTEIVEEGLLAAIPVGCMKPYLKSNQTTKKMEWSTKYNIEKLKSKDTIA